MSSTPHPANLAIHCKITPWILTRLGAITLLFTIFCLAFYIDGTKKYKEKNWVYYSYQPFKLAGEKYNELIQSSSNGTIEKQAWQSWINEQPPIWPEQGYQIISSQADLSAAWPTILHQLADINSNTYQKKPAWKLWVTYSTDYPFQAKNEPKHPYTLKQIDEQITYFYICLSLLIIISLTGFYLAKQTLSIDKQGNLNYAHISIPQSQWIKLSDAKWKDKGFAHLHYTNSKNQTKKIRLDGFIYGGFDEEKQVSSEEIITYIKAIFEKK